MFIFTSNPRGFVRLWRLSDSLSHDVVRSFDACLVAEFMSPFGARIMCLDASFEEEVLVCGDLRGNLVLFPLSKRILLDCSILFIEKTPSTYFKGAHGISTVCSISLVRLTTGLVEVCSTGGDGCICYLEYNRDQPTVEFVGMRHIKELSLVQSVSAHYSLDDSENISYTIGFSSTDFLIWNLLSETKVLQVKCGGWRRPHSYYLGQTPEICSGFAYVKDEIIYVHRYWVPDGENKIFLRNLHLQFHGKEIHSLCFIPEDVQCATPKISWVATGCEDGTVRLTRYNHGTSNWAMSNLLGEHVGGSAVRSLCFVSKLHSAEAKVVEGTNGTGGTINSLENCEIPCLLISVGAKRVLTSWLLRKRQKIEGDTSVDGLVNEYGSHKSSPVDMPSMSFKWLSSDMPVKSVRTKKKTQNSGNLPSPSDVVSSSDSVSASMEMELMQHGDAHDNDWRYLAVTAFLVNFANSRFTVCFVVVACSDATLMLRALVLPYRYWFDIASLAPLSSPVLALQHAVAPLCQLYQGKMMTKNIYIIISGSTDGSIAFWDVTKSIETFMQRVSSLHLEKSIDFQKRPRTGRGSQGGRWWKSVDAALNAKEKPTESMALKDNIFSSDKADVDELPEAMVLKGENKSSEHIEITSSKFGESFEDSCERSKLGHIGKEGDTISKLGNPEHTIQYDSNQSYSIKFLYQNKAVAAHSSAVKGVWTDGIWIFSTGLDQRVRCWNIQEHGNLAEHCHFITSVPEPEALDVTACGGNCYQVVVAGRGMQMIEFSLNDCTAP
uniref:Transducin/WD40 repeat-like superfamily protein n=1 Tax=Chenopodium quinoa TaxID=63459 RepID=A0A803M7A0_CHEQI